MIRILLIALILWPFNSIGAEEIKWDESSTISADINCDGTVDIAKLGYINNRVRLTVIISGNEQSQFIEFGLTGNYQDSLCDSKAILSTESMDYDLIEVFGENPEGFKKSKTCMGLNVRGGECDSMHIFWNHKTQHINWWRL